MENQELMIKIDNVVKTYRFGQIGGTTLKEEMQRLKAKMLHREDPTRKIGAKNYNTGEKFNALDGVSFEVNKGEAVGIIGHNGAGKSTLLKLLSRVTAPTKGTICLNGRIASMLEVGTGFHPELTGRENIYMNGAILGMTKKEIDAKIEDIIEFSEVRQFIDTPVKRYSSGMYVKLAFSVAAHLDSEIMIMDEVLAVGDMKFQQKCLTKMSNEAKSGRTVLYVSHNMSTIRQLCDRVIVMDHGKVVFNGDVEEGINIYSDYSDKKDISSKLVDLSTMKRTKELFDGIRLSSIEFLDDEHWAIDVGGKLHFEINAKSTKAFNNMSFRTRVTTLEGFSVSVLLAQDLFNCEANECIKIPLEADVSMLVPGRYCLTTTLYVTDKVGNTLFYDHIDRSVTFEVRDTAGFNAGMEWVPKYWGNVRLPALVDKRKK